MTEQKIFVGRKAELEKFIKVLEEPRGQAVLVVGQAGMGKTWLINKMADLAQNYPKLKCGWVRYEVTPTDSVNSILGLMMEHAFDAAQLEEKLLDATPRRLEQWRSLLNILKIGDLILSLRRDVKLNIRDHFLKQLELISKRMKENQRAIFIIDPEKYMQKESDHAWAIVIRQLPEKIKLVFAQRPEDVLVDSETFDALDNVVRIPDRQLDVLDEIAVEELIDRRSKDLKYTVAELRKVLRNYKGHPYTLGAALDLIRAGTKLEELPKKPELIKFAKVQWERICQIGDDAIQLFEAYAILEVGVPDEVVEAVSGLSATVRKRLQIDNYLRGLLREEGYGRRIYHVILAEHILEQIEKRRIKNYCARAVEVYRKKLNEDVWPDALAAIRLPEHTLVAQGEKAFVEVFLNESFEALFILGLYDPLESLHTRASNIVKQDSKNARMLKGFYPKIPWYLYFLQEIEKEYGRVARIAQGYSYLGEIYLDAAKVDKAKEMSLKALHMHRKLGREKQIAKDYNNLGFVYWMDHDLDRAQQMFEMALQVYEKLKDQKDIAGQCAELASFYRDRGDLDKAEQMYQRALGIYQLFDNNKDEIRYIYLALGLVYVNGGDLYKAEKMYQRAIEISEQLGKINLVAHSYANMAMIHDMRKDKKHARTYWKKARELFFKAKMETEAQKIQEWLNLSK